LLGVRAHAAAERRVAFPPVRHSTLVWRFTRLIVGWKISEYPGMARYLSALLGIAPSYARNLLKPSWKLPPKHAQKMADFLEKHASECDALAHELRAYAAAENIRKFANEKLAPRR
jgi:hypothetical protein